MTTSLRRYDPATDANLLDVERARAYLERATNPVDVKVLRDQAVAIERWLREQRASEASISHASVIKVRAERRLGQLYSLAEKAKGERSKSHPKTGSPKTRPPVAVEEPPTYAEQGVDKRDVSRWQRLAKIPEKKFETTLADVAEHNKRIATSRILGSVKQDEVRAKVEAVDAIEAKKASGTYDVIVIDPPWPIVKIERVERPNQGRELDYPTMTEEQIAAIKLPAASDCHVFLWTTQRFLPIAFGLLERWTAAYVCTFVWHKPGGFQPVGLPQFNCEFALYARFGSPSFVDTKALPTCFEAPRGAHSEKPEAFYDTVRRVTAGRRLDMFNRRPIEGFDAWGKEAAH